MNLFEKTLEALVGIPAGILNGFNPNAVVSGGAQAAAVATGEAIRTAILGGWTLQVWTASNAAWTVPDEMRYALEAWVFAIGGGARGEAGSTLENADNVITLGGRSMPSGGYIGKRIWTPTDLASTLAIVVGAASGSAGVNGALTTVHSGATLLVESIPGVSGIDHPLGPQLTSACPGNGGRGGDAMVPASTTGQYATDGEDGQSTFGALGGLGGAKSLGNSAASAGTSGGAGVTGAAPVIGGAGGAGGGGHSRYGGSPTGGNGGNGGYPGGASGSGGAAASNGTIYSPTGGTPGTAGNGLAWALWRG